MACKVPWLSLNTIHKPYSITSCILARPVTMQLQTTDKASVSGFRQVKMRILDGCKIHIFNYSFDYDGRGGEGTARARSDDHENGFIPISFDLDSFRIAPLTSTTAKVYGFVFPPFVTVHIEPNLFKGCIHRESGQVDLQFKGKIWFHVGGHKPPPLLLETELTSEESKGVFSGTKKVGERIRRDGKCRLVGVTMIERVEDDPTMNSLLGLPSECVADLRVDISFL